MRAEGQADSIVEDIENMVRSYVEKVYNMLHYDVGFNFFFQNMRLKIIWNIIRVNWMWPWSRKEILLYGILQVEIYKATTDQ